MSQRPIKRFYQEVGVEQGEDGFAVLLDGKRIRPPSQSAYALPTQALAEAIAEEWRAQGKAIDPNTMPLLRLTNTALERVADNRAGAIDQILAYGGSDLLCYRAPAPETLAAMQALEWNPWLAWLAERYGARLAVTRGVMPTQQPQDAITALRRAVKTRDDFALAGLAAAAAITGSLVLALALADRQLDAAEAFRLSTIDEAYQAQRWGLDEEAKERLDARAAELAAVERFLLATG